MTKSEKIYYQGFLLLTFVPGFMWLTSGVEKLIEGKFPLILKNILIKFATGNPYPFYKNFLQDTVIPNATTFGYLVVWGEFLTGLAMTFSISYLFWKTKNARIVKILLVTGLLGGLFLNINFYLGGGWTNQSKNGLNILMILLQTISLIFITRSLSKTINA